MVLEKTMEQLNHEKKTEQAWLNHMEKGTGKKKSRIAWTPTVTFCTCAIQGRSGGNRSWFITAGQCGNLLKLYSMRASRWFFHFLPFFFFIRVWLLDEELERTTVNRLLHSSGSHERCNRKKDELYDVKKPWLVLYRTKWKAYQKAVFYQPTNSNAVILDSCVPADCLEKKGKPHNRRIRVSQDTFIATSATIGYSQKCLASGAREHWDVSPRPSSQSTDVHYVQPLEHRQEHDLVGAGSCAWCDLYTRNPYVAQLYQTFHIGYVYGTDTVKIDLHLDLHRGRAMNSWPCVFQLSLLLLRLSAAWGTSGCSLRLFGSHRDSTIASVISVSCSKLRFASGGGSCGGGAGPWRRTAATAASIQIVASYTRCWWRERLPPFALRVMSLALRLLILPFLGGLGKTISCSLQSFVTFSGRHQDCFHARTTLFWMIHRLFTTCSCVGTSRAIVCVSKLLKVSFGVTALVALCRTSSANGGKRTGAYGCNTSAPASSSKLPVHRWPGGNRLIVRAFTTPLAVPINTVFDPSIGPTYLPCSNRDSRRPRRRLDGCKSIHHTRSPNCAKGGTARLPTFLSYAVLPSRPTANRRCMLAAYGTSHVNKSWSAGTSTPKADSTASLIDLPCPLTTQHRWIVGHLQQTFLAPHRQSKPISPPGVTREWRAHCHIEAPLSGNPKCPNLLRSSSPPSRNLGSRLLLWESPRCSTSASVVRFLTPKKQQSHGTTGTFEPSSSSFRPSPWCLSARPRPWTQAAHHDRKLACPVSTWSSISRDVGWRAAPSSRFTKFVTPDRFGITDASLSHFVSHVDIFVPRADTFDATSGATTSGTSVPGFGVLNSPNGPNSFSFNGLTGGPGIGRSSSSLRCHFPAIRFSTAPSFPRRGPGIQL